jgi:cytochrome c556
MNRFFVVTLCLLGSFAGGSAVAGPGGPEGIPAPTAPSVPPSLDKLYPPNTTGPLWLTSMFEMGSALSGTVADFLESDFANAEQRYGDFRDRYEALSQMVPEWTADFAREPVDALGPALQSHDPARFMPAVEQVSQVCQACHVRSMTDVQQRYHWGDFSTIVVTDPVSRTDVPFAVFMQMLDGDLSGVQADLTEGQLDQARSHAAALATRYTTLRDACTACHDTERSYYVDAAITGEIESLADTLAAATPDPASVWPVLQGIGMESCHKCHLVHGPAALARHTFETVRP